MLIKILDDRITNIVGCTFNNTSLRHQLFNFPSSVRITSVPKFSNKPKLRKSGMKAQKKALKGTFLGSRPNVVD